MIDFKRDVVRALATEATAVLLDPELGVAQCIADGSLPPTSGLLVAVEATGYEGPSTLRMSRVLDGWGVAQAKRVGATAIKLLVYYRPEASNVSEQESLVAQVAREAEAEQIPLFLEPLSYSLRDDGAKLTGEARREVVIETARRLTSIGGDILKAEFPYDASMVDVEQWKAACEELNEASAVPWVLLSGGVDVPTFEAQTEAACRAGASGVAVGRSVWAESARLASGKRQAFLLGEGRARLRRLTAIVERFGAPWEERSSLPAEVGDPGERWYREQ